MNNEQVVMSNRLFHTLKKYEGQRLEKFGEKAKKEGTLCQLAVAFASRVSPENCKVVKVLMLATLFTIFYTKLEMMIGLSTLLRAFCQERMNSVGGVYIGRGVVIPLALQLSIRLNSRKITWNLLEKRNYVHQRLSPFTPLEANSCLMHRPNSKFEQQNAGRRTNQ